MEYKGYNIRLNKSYTMYSIHMIGKGALPKHLQGLYTTKNSAFRQIDQYLGLKEEIKE
jgi:hypothetical protein